LAENGELFRGFGGFSPMGQGNLGRPMGRQGTNRPRSNRTGWYGFGVIPRAGQFPFCLPAPALVGDDNMIDLTEALKKSFKKGGTAGTKRKAG
jgi:hypothetical protein